MDFSKPFAQCPSEFLKNSAAICVILVLKIGWFRKYLNILFKNSDQHYTAHAFQNQLLNGEQVNMNQGRI